MGCYVHHLFNWITSLGYHCRFLLYYIMKATDIVKHFPIDYLVWNLNEDTNIFWTELSSLEDNGMFDPWGRKLALGEGRRKTNRHSQIEHYQFHLEFQG